MGAADKSRKGRAKVIQIHRCTKEPGRKLARPHGRGHSEDWGCWKEQLCCREEDAQETLGRSPMRGKFSWGADVWHHVPSRLRVLSSGRGASAGGDAVMFPNLPVSSCLFVPPVMYSHDEMVWWPRHFSLHHEPQKSGHELQSVPS